MKISYVAVNRIVEDHAATDEQYRKQLERIGKAFLSSGRRLSDEQLLAKLRDLGIDLNRHKLDELSQRSFSAEELSRTLVAESRSPIRETDEDWVWIALACLWERWFPNRASMEMIDDRMQEGYRALKEKDSAAACRRWLDTWRAILGSTAQHGIDTLADFDDRFDGTQCLFNWVQDLETELGNAGSDVPEFLQERIAFCETVLERSAGWSLTMSNFKRGLADTYFRLGQAQGEELYRTWLEEEPQWGWGWIGWADRYWGYGPEAKNAERAEQILKRGLEVPDVDDREYLLDRLHDLYEETGRADEARAVRRRSEELKQPKVTTHVTRTDQAVQVRETVNFGEQGLPLNEFRKFAESMRSRSPEPMPRPASRPQRIGRNDLCPCGSGKKFKRCCGRR